MKNINRLQIRLNRIIQIKYNMSGQMKQIKLCRHFWGRQLNQHLFNLQIQFVRILQFMGQTQDSCSNPLLSDWKKHPHEDNVFYNIKTNDQAERHRLLLSKQEQLFFKKRIQDNHNFIVKILYMEPVDENTVNEKQNLFYVYAQKLLPLSYDKWVPVTSSLSLLKGFRRLSFMYGIIKVNIKMVKVTSKKQIRVWFDENPLKNQVKQRMQNQRQMLEQITKIINQFDSHSSSLISSCITINDSINNILHSLTNNKSEMNLSNYSNKVTNNQKKIIPINSTNSPLNIRNKDTSSFNIKDHQKIQQKAKDQKNLQIDPNQISLKSAKNLKSPTSFNNNNDKIEFKKIEPVVSRKFANNQMSSFISSQVGANKQGYANSNSQSIKLSNFPRTFKPNEDQTYETQSQYPIRSHVTPTNRDKMQEEAKSFKQYLHQPNLQAESKSVMTKNFRQKMYASQENNLEEINMKDSQTNEIFENDSEKQRQKQIMQSQSFSVNRNYNGNIYFDVNRTKTQQFYVHNSQMGHSQRAKTNYFHANTPSHQYKGSIAQSHIQVQKITYENKSILPNKLIKQEKEVQNDPKSDTKALQNKKMMKQLQALKIKQEMNILGIENEPAKSLGNQKSMRDLLIKQKVQQKNKKHEELKFAITKLLSE